MRAHRRRSRACPATLGALLAAACGPDAPAERPAGGPSTGAASAPSAPWLTDVTEAWGLAFEQDPGPAGSYRMPEIMGGGLAVFDAEGDGDLDLYLVDGHDGLPGARPPEGSTRGANRLFLQEPTDAGLRFVDATEASGLGDRGYGMGAAVADLDRDGDLDVYVTNYGPDRLYRNVGGGRFVDATADAGIDVPGWSVSAAFLDYDRDGRLDLYVAQYVDWDPAKTCRDAASRPDYCGPTEFPPRKDVLLRNESTPEGGLAFRDVSAAAGPGGPDAAAAAGLGVVCEDFDGDGWTDVYVANDAYANHLWINRRDGTFEDRAIALGAAYNLNGQAEAGMGVVSEDFDGDGRFDLFMTHLGQETNTLYVFGAGGGAFTDTTGRSGLGPSSMRYTGFGTAALDLELDGDLDLAVVNGRVVRNEPLPGADTPAPWGQFAEPNLLFLNEGGVDFREAGAEGGEFVKRIEISRGLVAADLDGDGDDDLVLANVHGPARVYRNDAPRRGSWLAVRAVVPVPSADATADATTDAAADAIGARVEVATGERVRVRAVRAGAGYLSCGPAVARFGLGDARRYDELRVAWPDGTREVFDGGDADRAVVVVHGAGRPEAPR